MGEIFMKRLTLFSKIALVVVLLAITAFLCYDFGLFDSVINKTKTSNTGSTNTSKTNTGSTDVGSTDANVNDTAGNTDSNTGNTTTPGKTVTIKLTLDEWIGWKPILDANGGLETQPGSIMDKHGVKLEIQVANDATQSSTALIQGSTNAAGYTVNRYAFLYPKFIDAGVPVQMVYITNSSNGGDGIISKSSIKSIEQLVGKKIAVPRYSEAQTLIMWMIQNSSLTQKEKDGVVKSMVYFDTPDDAAKAFFGGKVDAAATWEPYLSQAQTTTGARALFTTKSATKLILDGIIFRQDFAEANPEAVTNFIDACLEAESLYATDSESIKAFPLFSTETAESINSIGTTALISNYADNVAYLGGTAQDLYIDMCAIWGTVKDEVTGDSITSRPDAANDAITDKYLTPLSSKYVQEKEQVITFTPEAKETAQKQNNNEALLKQTLTIKFEPNLAVIAEDSFDELQVFAKTATILNGAIIQIEGNIADTGVGDTKSGRLLSEQRAKSVATYLQQLGIDPTRFIVIGNGVSKPVDGLDPTSEEGKKANRRTDIYFKAVE